MAVAQAIIDGIAERYAELGQHLTERQRRLWAGCEAKVIGHGGLRAVSRATGMSTNTVKAGILELVGQSGSLDLPASGRQRRPGGGRPRAEDKDPGLVDALDSLVEPVTRGEPTSPLRWSAKSASALARELTANGHPVGVDVVCRLLKEQGYSLQSNRKRHEGKQHPDRDAQFYYINNTCRAHLEAGLPVVSVDTKAKELVGNFANNGREWQPKGQPVEVEAYDFPSKAVGKAVPYGVYDIVNNEGWVSVGINKDTAQLAVNTLDQWWRRMGQERFEGAAHLLVTCDNGGSNSSRARLWKTEVQRFANETGLWVTVLHYPPGTSKWNKIEHRMFNHITMNWRGRPLVSFEVVVNCIASTSTSTGLKIEAALDETLYKTGIKVSDKEMNLLNINRHRFHGDWNYTIKPQK